MLFAEGNFAQFPAMESWQLDVLIRALVAAAVIVISLAIMVVCYCCAKNKRCPVYKRRQEARARMNELNRPENTRHLNYPRQQRVPPNTGLGFNGAQMI